MPTMYEIYERHADRYHELVRAEDYEGNLSKLLHRQVQWKGASVLEAGTGTGRVTDIYVEEVGHAICCDRSSHMLDFAKTRLSSHLAKVEFSIAENLRLPDLTRKVDVFIEGWSFGHTFSDFEGEDEMAAIARRLVENAAKNVVEGGAIVLIESLGTNVDSPAPPTDKLRLFFELLGDEYGFEQHVVRTDYRFASNDEAVRIMGFFFGSDRVPEIRARDSGIIPEWTAVWIRRKR